MYKFVALYRKPEDPESFDQAYFGTHIPLVNKIPGLDRVIVNRITGAPRGDPEFYMTAELCFPDKETMERGLASDENREAGKNLMSFARGLAVFMYAQEVS